MLDVPWANINSASWVLNLWQVRTSQSFPDCWSNHVEPSIQETWKALGIILPSYHLQSSNIFHKTVFAQCISPFFYLTNQPLCIFDGSQGQNMSSRPQPGHPPGRSSGKDLPRGASEYHWHHHPPQWSAEFRNLRRERTWIQDIQDIQVPPCLAMTMWDPRKSGLLTFKTSPFQCFPQEDRSSIDVPRLQVLLFSRPSKDGLFYRSE